MLRVTQRVGQSGDGKPGLLTSVSCSVLAKYLTTFEAPCRLPGDPDITQHTCKSDGTGRGH